MPLNQDAIYQAIDELRAISSAGLYYTSNEYDKERYQRVLAIALHLLASLEEHSFDEVMREFQEDNWPHRSPAAGAEAVIVKEGKILLIKRSDNHLWAVPGGLAEVGETLAEAAQRELWEETGIIGQITKLLGVFDSRLWRSKTKSQLYHVIFFAETTNSRFSRLCRERGPDLGVRACVRTLSPPNPGIYHGNSRRAKLNTEDEQRSS